MSAHHGHSESHESETFSKLPRDLRDKKRGRTRRRHHHHHHHHRVRTNAKVWVRVLIVVLLVLVVAIGGVGAAVALSARSVLDKARGVRKEAQGLEQSLLSGDGEKVRDIAQKVNAGISDIQGEVNTPVWRIASFLPIVGHDVSNARTLADCARDLSSNALVPFADNVAGVPLTDLVKERSVDVAMLNNMRGTVVQIAPVIVNNAQTMNSLTPGVVDQLNELLGSLREPLSTAEDLLGDADGLFSMLLGVLGDGGQTRTYLILALSNAEARPGGGYPGSVGLVQVTNGVAELGTFQSVLEVDGIVRGHEFCAALSQDEKDLIGVGVGSAPREITLTPDFSRVGQIAKEEWEDAYGTKLDGAIAMDPVFLQKVIAMVGDIEADDGTVLTGDNAAYELLNNVYWRYGYETDGNAKEDAFFSDVADKSFSRLLDKIGDFDMKGLGELWQTIKEGGEEHRFKVWMADETQQSYMRDFGISGELQKDINTPELGLYATDYTWSKMCWYLNIGADVGQPQRNADGTTSYHVTAHFRNSITQDDAAEAPRYITGGNPTKRDASDMIERIFVMAPLGATISDYEVHQDEPVADEVKANEHDLQGLLYERDTRISFIHILGGGDTTVTFTLTLPEGVDARPQVRTNPLAQG